MIRSGFALMLLAVLTGCGDKSTPTGTESGSPSVTAGTGDAATATATAAAAAQSSAGGRNEAVSNDLFEFAYSYPAQAAAIPGLRALLDARLEKERGALEKRAKEDRDGREKGQFPYHPHTSETGWQVVAQTPRWLSLSAQAYGYSGGAHGMTNFDALLWDRQENAARQPIDLFTAPAALRDAIRTPFCQQLNVERAKKRGQPIAQNSSGMFDECIDPLGETVILGSSNGTTFNRIGVLIAPYSAGPYAEGTYEVTLPVTQAVLDAVKPAYRDGFSIMR